jgi:UTP--glucose-1-phosphate uridylyltransferase
MSTQRVRKAVIAVAGTGTRFLPATKAMPKEIFPVIDKPIIQYVVEEAVASGITDIILVTSGTKRPIEDHFDDNETLEAWLKKTGKERALEEIRKISKLANFIYIRQKGPYGTATPVLCAERLIGNEPFAMYYGDEIFQTKVPRLKQMLPVYEKYQHPVLGVIPVDREGTKRFGIVKPKAKVGPHTYQIDGLLEKPGPEHAPSRLASIGTLLLTPDIFDVIRNMPPGHGGEYYLAEAVAVLMKDRPVYAQELTGTWHDAGSKVGWLRANIALALERPDLKKDVKKMLREFEKKGK